MSTSVSNDTSVPGGVLTKRVGADPFEVHLDVFTGPFDLLLGLIAQHKLDITEVALAQVTDEFIAQMRLRQDEAARARQEGRDGVGWDLSQASEFVLVAATLLDLKASRLLPAATSEDEEDVALLEARDLLFARLLQYRAYKEVATWMADQMAGEELSWARQAGLEPHFAALLPELVLGITPEELARIAALAMTPRPPPVVAVEHLHAPRVSVREQAVLLHALIRERGDVSFAEVTADAEGLPVVVARFLALLELFRGGLILFDQPDAFAPWRIRWDTTAAADTAAFPSLRQEQP
ncbi:MAG: segregation/condensation protein A [Austwickia sp.]|nr:segregation/condensation protein A [Austwickia sp.]